MTKTVTIIDSGVRGVDKYVHATVDITSYTASGEAFTASDFGINRIKSLVILDAVSDNGHVWRRDATSDLIRAFKADASEGTATLTATDGSAIVTENWGNIKGGNASNQVTSGAAGVNDAVVHAAAGVTTGLVNTGITNPVDGPRNMKIVLSSAGGGTLPADCGTVALIGTDYADAALTETIALSPVNGVVLGAGGVVFVKGAKAFKTLTSYQFSINLAASVADIQGSVGLGTILGMSKAMDPATGETAVLKVFKNDTAVAAATYVGDGSLNVVDLGANLADNDDIIIQYLTDSDAAGGSVAMTGNSKVDVEATSTNDVGACRVEVYGR